MLTLICDQRYKNQLRQHTISTLNLVTTFMLKNYVTHSEISLEYLLEDIQ